MKKYIVIGLLIVAGIIILTQKERIFGATPLLQVGQGGTGWGDITSGTYLTGNGTGRLSTSTCAQITGSADLCDGADATSAGSLIGTVSTSTSPTVGNLAYWTSKDAWPELLGTVATGTVSAGAGISVTANQSIIGAGLTITNLIGYPFPSNATSTALTLSGGIDASGGNTTLGVLLGTLDVGGATSFEVPNGASPTVDAAGEIAVDTTSDQLIYFGAAKRVLVQDRYPVFGYSTSTTFTGTTTLYLAPATVAQTWNTIRCETDAGFIGVSVYDGTNKMDYFVASTTIGTVTLSTNNAFTLGESRRIDFGTTTSATKNISCSAVYSVTAD